jgi:hypothetical protein
LWDYLAEVARMQWSDIPLAPPERTLRQFAGLWLLFFTGLACRQALAHGFTPGTLGLGLLAVVLGGLGLWRPKAIRPVFVGAVVLTFPISWAVSWLALSCLYYAVFAPLGLLFRLLGRDALKLRPCPEQTTCWEPRPQPGDVRRYFRQF